MQIKGTLHVDRAKDWQAWADAGWTIVEDPLPPLKPERFFVMPDMPPQPVEKNISFPIITGCLLGLMVFAFVAVAISSAFKSVTDGNDFDRKKEVVRVCPSGHIIYFYEGEYYLNSRNLPANSAGVC